MTTYDHYAMPVADETWDVPMDGSARFTWEYDGGFDRLLNLYQKGKDKQWDQTTRIDWSIEVDPYNVLNQPDEMIPIYGSRQWQKVERDESMRQQIAQHMTAWQFSQFLHGEQGAMICSARIVESVPGIEAKFYAATQTMDEARHAETYSRFLQEKIGLLYPMNPYLKTLLDQTLADSRWDMPYLGMQVLIEGLALAAFGYLRDLTGGGRSPLAHQILSYVMQDEARHVAFGRMALKEYYSQLSAKELDEREEFVVEGCYLMRDRLQAREVWENLGFDVEECMEYVEKSPVMRMFRAQLFNRIVPCVKDIGLWGDRVQKAYADMGVLDLAGNDLEALMKSDEDLAEQLDRDRREMSARADQVGATIAVGASA